MYTHNEKYQQNDNLPAFIEFIVEEPGLVLDFGFWKLRAQLETIQVFSWALDAPIISL